MSSLNLYSNEHDAPEMAPAAAEVSEHPSTGEVEKFKLKITGRRPKQFQGTLLCSAMSFFPGPPQWYEINIYRVVSGKFIIEVKLFAKSDQERDFFRMHECNSFDEVVEFLENHDPAQDIDAGRLKIKDDSLAPAEIALAAIAMKLRIEDARRQFGTLVGEILYDVVSD